MTTRRPDVGYRYPISKQQFKNMIGSVCKLAGCSLPIKPANKPLTSTCFEAKLGKEIVYFGMTARLMPFNQLTDISYFVVIVTDSKRTLASARYYYVSLCFPETVEALTPLEVNREKVAEIMVEFIKDAQLPVAERKYQLPEVPSENFGAWSGGVQQLPACWSDHDLFIRRSA